MGRWSVRFITGPAQTLTSPTVLAVEYEAEAHASIMNLISSLACPVPPDLLY